MRRPPHVAAIKKYISEPSNWGVHTRAQLRTLISQEVNYNVTEEQLRNVLRSNDALDVTVYVSNNQYTKPTQLTKYEKKPSFKMNLRKRDPSRILIIGDLHEPFCLLGYREFCIETAKKFDCTHTIFIGDIIDNHFTSYHETDPDGMSALDEFAHATNRINKWVEAFPQADVVIGNHDRLVTRKAFTAGISGIWLKEYNEVLNAPGWDFQEEFTYHDVRYIHGEQGTARNRAKKDLISTVQGHRHTEAYTEHIVGQKFHIFGTQVGCGVDRKAYAMAYAQAGPKPVIGCAVVLENGTLPINILADL